MDGVLEGFAPARRVARACAAGWRAGWHEANGGNVSVRLTSEEAGSLPASVRGGSDGSVRASWSGASEPRDAGDAAAWQPLPLPEPLPALAGERFLVSRSGCYLRFAEQRTEADFGVVEVSPDGSSWRLNCGFSDGGRPTSELAGHLLAHDALKRSGRCDRVIYHAHAPRAVALSTVLPPSSREWSRALWKGLTEAIIMMPAGIEALPWIMPGSEQLARATAAALSRADACVWAQHGVVCTAPDIDVAFGRVETIEKAAGICLDARAACGGREPEHRVSDGDLLRIAHALGLDARIDYLS